MKISYSILTHNETDSLSELIDFLVINKEEKDEIVILDDFSDDRTQEVFRAWMSQYQQINWKFEQRALNKDFAAQKNYLTGMCSGDYIINIDADEIPHDVFLNQIKQVIEINDVDLIWVPRVNTVEGITEQHIQQWGWRVNEKGWINYPDYQARVYKNAEHIKWIKPVHERIDGAKTYSHLPPHEELSFYHHKKIDKQEAQNKMYEGIK